MAHLPPESALTAELRVKHNRLSDEERKELERKAGTHDFEAEQWSRLEQLLASVRDELHFIRHSYDSAHSKNKLKWSPEQLPRPGIKPKKVKAPLTDQAVDVLWAHLQNQLEEGS